MYENGNTSGSGDADDLVPMIMWVLCQSGMVSAEVEADYMWGLLLPSASSGEASYYLEAFHSAIHALKNLSPSPEPSPGNSLDSVKPVIHDDLIIKVLKSLQIIDFLCFSNGKIAVIMQYSYVMSLVLPLTDLVC